MGEVCFVFFKDTDSSQRSCTQSIFADVKVKAWRPGGDLHLRVYLPFAWRYFLHQKTCQMGPKKEMFLDEVFHKHTHTHIHKNPKQSLNPPETKQKQPNKKTPKQTEKKRKKRGALLSEHSVSFSAAYYDGWTRKRIRYVKGMEQPANSLKRKNHACFRVLKRMHILHFV